MKKNIYFTSDQHYFHTNIIKYQANTRGHCSGVESMNREMLDKHNAVVRPQDVVYMLGDVAFCQPDEFHQVMSRLNGEKHLVYGNHDKKIRLDATLQAHFASVQDYLELSVDGQKIVMSHYPMLSWNRMGGGAWMLHGHCHANMRYPFRGRICDVGVDAWAMAPVSMRQLRAKLDPIVVEFLDHHD